MSNYYLTILSADYENNAFNLEFTSQNDTEAKLIATSHLWHMVEQKRKTGSWELIDKTHNRKIVQF